MIVSGATLKSMIPEGKIRCTKTIRSNNLPCGHGELASDNYINTILTHFFNVA